MSIPLRQLLLVALALPGLVLAQGVSLLVCHCPAAADAAAQTMTACCAACDVAHRPDDELAAGGHMRRV